MYIKGKKKTPPVTRRDRKQQVTKDKQVPSLRWPYRSEHVICLPPTFATFDVKHPDTLITSDGEMNRHRRKENILAMNSSQKIRDVMRRTFQIIYQNKRRHA